MIPRINFQWTHRRVGLTIQRRQFPLRLSYAVTFNKSQGKNLKFAVVDLRNAPFAHGQLYVALSRVRCGEDIFLLCDAGMVKTDHPLYGPCVVTTNVVEKVALLRTLPPHLRDLVQQTGA